jgi:thiol:disulfide interchange protein DsbA
MRSILTWLIVLVVHMALAQAATGKPPYDEGVEYQRLAAPQPTTSPDKIEVVELFWYGCPHCFDLEPAINKWLASKPDDVEFVRIPAILGQRWELLARAYYTAELLGVVDRIHEPLFRAIHEEDARFPDEDSLEEFFVAQGVDREDFRNTFNSFAVATRLNNARLMTMRYNIEGVPAIVVNGKFRTSASLAGSNEEMLKVTEYLVEQERDAMRAAVPASGRP